MSEELKVRKSPRLRGYDYTQNGAYFVTICCHNRRKLFGEVKGDDVALTTSGKIAYHDLQNLPTHWTHVDIDLFVVMPNHVHAILIITDEKDTNTTPLGQIIGNYKSGVTRRIRQELKCPNMKIWQPRFHDHIIRHESALNYIRQYVLYNPASWTADTFYSD